MGQRQQPHQRVSIFHSKWVVTCEAGKGQTLRVGLLSRGWALLDRQEKRSAVLTLAVIVLSALSSAVMVGSIMPFLSILADPDQIREIPFLAWVYDAAWFRTDYEFLIAVGLASLAAIVLANAIQVLRLYLVTKFGTMRMHSLSVRLLRVFLKRPYEYFLNQHSGELSSQILAETQKAVEYFYRPAAEAIASLFTAVAIVALLVWVNPLVAVAALATAGILYVGSYVVSRKVVSRYGGTREKANLLRYRVASEALAGIKDVKLLGRETQYLESYSKPSFKMASSEAMAIFIGTLPQYVIQIVAFGGMIVLVIALIDPSKLADTGTMRELLPLLGVFAFGGLRLLPELAKIYTGITQVNYGASIIEKLYAELSTERTLPELPSPNCAPMGLMRELELRDLTYTYPNAEAAGLVGVSVRIRAGERIGIVGGSGAGKTTLADVIMGLLEIDAGQIVVDGVALAENNIHAWQRSVGYVQQEIFLSDASILENIALGVPAKDIDRERALEAARSAQLDDFVRHSLPDQYETLVGERGVRLSGGQRQRIGIARALYNNADLLVFDEATSALDNVTEKQVMESIEALPGNKTVILIAHRLSTLEKCQRLIVMKQGCVVGLGTWEELLANNVHFQELASAVREGRDTVTRARSE